MVVVCHYLTIYMKLAFRNFFRYSRSHKEFRTVTLVWPFSFVCSNTNNNTQARKAVRFLDLFYKNLLCYFQKLFQSNCLHFFYLIFLFSYFLNFLNSSIFSCSTFSFLGFLFSSHHFLTLQFFIQSFSHFLSLFSFFSILFLIFSLHLFPNFHISRYINQIRFLNF